MLFPYANYRSQVLPIWKYVYWLPTFTVTKLYNSKLNTWLPERYPFLSIKTYLEEPSDNDQFVKSLLTKYAEDGFFLHHSQAMEYQELHQVLRLSLEDLQIGITFVCPLIVCSF